MKNNNSNGKHQNLAQHTLDVLDDSVFWLDSEARFFMVNKGACRNLGYSEEELLKMTVHDIDPQFPKEMWKESWDLIRAEIELVIESKHTRKDGVIFPVKVRGKHITFEGKEYLCATARDISERKSNEQSLKNSEAKYRTLFEGANDAIFIMEREKFLECNSKTLDVFGVQKAEEIVGLCPWDFSPKFQPDGMDSHDMALTLIKKAQAGTAQRFFWKHTKADGTEFDAEVSLNRLEIGKKRNLIQAIVRDISDLVETRDALKISEAAARALINATEDGALLIDPSTRIIELNDASAKIFGQDRDQLIGKIGFDEMPEELAMYRRHKLDQVLHTKKSLKFEAEWDNRIYMNNIYPILDRDGEVIQIAIFERDITEEKEAARILRESEEKFSKVFNHSPMSIYITTIPEGRFVNVNPIFEKISGFKRKEIIGKTSLEMGFYVDSIHRETALKKLKTEGKLADYEISFRIKSGDIRLCIVNAEIIEFRGQPHLLSMIRDITEQRRAEQAVKASEEKYRNLAENSLGGIWQIDSKGNTQYINPAMCKVLEISEPEEILGKSFRKFFKEESLRIIDKELGKRKKGVSSSYEVVTIGKKGTKRDIMMAGVPILSETGEYKGSIGTCTDITDRRKAEELLRLSEQRFRSLIEHTSEGIFCYEYDPHIPTDIPTDAKVKMFYDGTLVECNDVCARSYGAQMAEEVIGKKLTENFSTEPGGLDDFFKTFIHNGYHQVDAEGEEILEDGTRRYFLNNGYGVIENGKLLRIWGTFREITERKKMEEDLKTLSLAIEQSPSSIVIIDPEGIVEYANSRFFIRNQYKPEEIIGKNWRSFLAKSSTLREKLPEIQDTVLHKGKIWRGEVSDLANGHKLWRDTAIIPIRNEKGTIIHVAYTSENITERKLAEEALRESEERLKAFMNSATDSFYLLDNELNFTMVNKNGLQIMKRELKDVVGKNIKEIVPDIVTSGRYAQHQEVMKTSKPFMIEDFIPHPEFGDKHFILKSFKVGNGLGVTSIDITERKKAEQALKASEEKFRTMIETSPDAVSTSDLEANLTYVTQKTAELHGFDDPEEMLGMNAMDLFDPDDRQRARDNIGKTITEGIIKDAEYRLLRKDGSSFYAEMSGSPIKDSKGNPTGFIVITRDITSRKKIEKALRESEERYRMLIENIPTVVWKTNRQGKTSFISQNVEKIYGFTTEQLYKEGSKLWIDRIHPEDRQRVLGSFALLFEKGVEFNEEYRIQKKDGEWIWLSDRASNVNKENGEYYAYGVFSDISDRKKVEEELKESEERLKILFEFAPDAIYLNDLKGNFIDGNKASEELLGFKRKELVGKNLLKLSMLSKDQIGKATKALGRSIAGKPTGPDEFTLKRKDGSEVVAEIRTYPVKIKDQTTVLGIARDVSERKRIEEELKVSEDKFSKAFQTSPSPMTITTMDEGILIDANSSFEKNFGYSRAEALNKTSMELGIFTNSSERMKIVDDLIANGRINKKVVPFTTRSGETRICNLSVEKISVGDQNLILSVVDDITELRNSEKIRQIYEENLKKLASELMLTEARERHNIATDLHDNLGQSLAITKITLAGLDKSGLKPEGRKDIKTIESLISDVIDQTRSLTYDLSPPILYELGLLPAIKWNLDRIGKMHNFQTRIEGEETVIKLDSDHEILIYRTINELLINIIKHSRAKKIKVDIRKDIDLIHFVVEDDGIGFSFTSLDDEIHEEQKFGLFSVRERLGYMKGSMKVRSRPGEGTQITLTVPGS